MSFPTDAPPPEEAEGLDTPPLFEGALGADVDYNVPSFQGVAGEQKRLKLGRRVIEEYQAWREYIDDRRINAQDWRRDFEQLENDGPTPWEGAAATRSPLSAIAVQAHAQKLNTAVFGTNPPFNAKARKRAALSAAPIIEDVVESHLDGAKWQDSGRQVHQGLGIDGNCLLRVTWEVETERVRCIKWNLDEAALDSRALGSRNPADALLETIQRDAQGRPTPFLVPEDVKVHDGTRLRYIPFYRSVMLPPTAEDPRDLWAVGEIVRIRGVDLREGAKTGKYIEEEVNLLLQRHGDPKDSDDDQEQAEIAGTSRTDGRQANALFREYECVELCWHDCLDVEEEDAATTQDVTLEWYVLTVHIETMRCLRVAYSPYEHGRSYYVPFRYLMRDGELLYASVAERAAMLQAIATFLFNSILDLISVLKGTSTSFAYDWTAGIKPGNLEYQPGRPWGPLKNINGIRDLPVGHNIPQAITACVTLLGIVKEWFDLLTGASNTVMGKAEAGSQTAYEIGTLFGQATAIFEDHSRGVMLSWAEVADLVRWNIRQFAPGGEVEYSVEAKPEQLLPDSEGQPQRFVYQSQRNEQGILLPPEPQPLEGQYGFGLVPAHLLGADVDMVPAGISQLPDRQARLQRDMLISNLATAHPVIGQMRTVLVELFKTVLESGQAPNREQVLRLIDAELQRIQQMELMALAAQELGAASETGKAVAEEGRASQQAQQGAEEHQLGMQERKAALVGGPPANGKAKK